jgi:hypothetical protein
MHGVQWSQWLEGSMEWSGVISGYSMEFHGVPKGDVAKPNRAYRHPLREGGELLPDRISPVVECRNLESCHFPPLNPFL